MNLRKALDKNDSTEINRNLNDIAQSMYNFMETVEEYELCDHGDSEQSTEHFESPRIDEHDLVWDEPIIVCHNCKAWRYLNERFWNHD